MQITLRVAAALSSPDLRWWSLTIARCPLGRPTGNLKPMLDALSIALPLVLAAVLIASAVAKLRTPDDLSGWRDLGVPARLRREWLRRAHPWAEGALGDSLAVLGSWLGLLAALVAVALMAAYTVLVARVLRRSSNASCACFGTRRRVTRVTVARNVWLTALAVGAAAVIWTTPVLGGALAAGIPQFAWLVALAIAAVTTAFILWPERRDDVDGSTAGPGVQTTEDDLDYIRTRTPAVPVTLADGTSCPPLFTHARRPLLLLAVSSMCGACESVMERRESTAGSCRRSTCGCCSRSLSPESLDRARRTTVAP